MLRNQGLTDVVYSLAIANPGRVALHNFPTHLRQFDPLEGAARSTSLPSTSCAPGNGGCRATTTSGPILHMPRLQHFEQLTDPHSLARLKQLYGVGRRDRHRGRPSRGIAAARVRVQRHGVPYLPADGLPALQSDRFLTVDFRPEVYTRLGMDWIARNGFRDVLARHCPELTDKIGGGKAVFAPW